MKYIFKYKNDVLFHEMFTNTWLHSLWLRGGTQYVFQMLWENQANILHIDVIIDNDYD